jgi:hypothetical protein
MYILTFSYLRICSCKQQFPLMTCESYATMEADNSVRVSTTHFRLLKRLSRFDMPGGLVASHR